MADSSHPPAKKLILDEDKYYDGLDPFLFPKSYTPGVGVTYPEPVVWVDVGRNLKLFAQDSVSEKFYTWFKTKDANWWVLNSFLNTSNSPYKKEIFTVDKQLTEVLQIDAHYLEFLKSLPYYPIMSSSNPVVSHYKTRSVQKGKDSKEDTPTPVKVVQTSVPSKVTQQSKVVTTQPGLKSLLTMDKTGLDSAVKMSKLPDTSCSTESPNKTTPVPYIRSNTAIPQIPPGQVINPEFVREELYTRTSELWCRFDDPKSGLSHVVASLENKLAKVSQDKRALEERVALLETEVTGEKIGIRDKVKVLQSQMKIVQGELKTLNATRMDLKIGIGEDDEVMQASFDDFHKFREAVIQENEALARKVDWMVAAIDQNTLQIDHLQVMTASNAEKLMQNSIKIGGVPEVRDVKPKQAAISFFKQQMGLKFDVSDVYYAFRKGDKSATGAGKDGRSFPRFLHVKVAAQLYHKIWNSRRTLAGKQSEEGFKFFVALTKPAVIRAADRRYAGKIKQIIEEDKDKEKKDKRFAKVLNGKFYIADQYQPDPIEPPTLKRRMELQATQSELINSFEVLESSIYPLEGSNNFQAFAIRVASFKNVEMAYCRIKKDNVYATHTMMACYFQEEGSSEEVLFSCDDGEYEAGMEIEKELKNNGIANLAVFVTRYRFKRYELGPKRFIAIREVTKRVLAKVNDTWVRQDGLIEEETSLKTT